MKNISVMNLKKALKNKKGSASYVESAITVIVLIFVVAFFINIFSFFATYEELEYLSEQMVVAAATYGSTGDSRLETRKEELCSELGLEADKLTFDWTGTVYMSSTGSYVQLGDQIKLTISYEAKILGWGNEDLGTTSSITLTATHSGLSEVYRK